MLKPTKDKEAIKAIADYMSPILFYCPVEEMKGLVGEFKLDNITKNILTRIEKLGYHKDEPKKIYNPTTKNKYTVQPIKPDQYLQGIMKHKETL
jgi:hypothetical protein